MRQVICYQTIVTPYLNKPSGYGTKLPRLTRLSIMPLQVNSLLRHKVSLLVITEREVISLLVKPYSHIKQQTLSKRFSDPRPEILLTLNDGTNTVETHIYYIEGTTTGFDNGYDSSIFGNEPQSFSIYTQLVSDSEGENLAIQSLPNENFEDMVIPVGVHTDVNTNISISADAINLPEGIKVYLEDKVAETFTVLDSSSNFSLTTTNNLSGANRFYLHTTSEVLTIHEEPLEQIKVYVSDENNLKIIGFKMKQLP